jgi:hypothetical protein
MAVGGPGRAGRKARSTVRGAVLAGVEFPERGRRCQAALPPGTGMHRPLRCPFRAGEDGGGAVRADGDRAQQAARLGLRMRRWRSDGAGCRSRLANWRRRRRRQQGGRPDRRGSGALVAALRRRARQPAGGRWVMVEARRGWTWGHAARIPWECPPGMLQHATARLSPPRRPAASAPAGPDPRRDDPTPPRSAPPPWRGPPPLRGPGRCP